MLGYDHFRRKEDWAVHLGTPIQGNVIVANPETFDSAKRLAQKLYDHGNKKGAKTAETEAKKEGNNKKNGDNKWKGR